jgi:hypothetical protein
MSAANWKTTSTPRVARLQIDHILNIGRTLVPFLQRLNIDRPDDINCLAQQVLDEVATDEASSTADSDSLVLKFQLQFLLGEH